MSRSKCENKWCEKPILVMSQQGSGVCSQLCGKAVLGKFKNREEWEKRVNASIQA